MPPITMLMKHWPLTTYAIVLMPILVTLETFGISKGEAGFAGALHMSKPVWAWPFYYPALIYDTFHPGWSFLNAVVLLLLAGMVFALILDMLWHRVRLLHHVRPVRRIAS